MARAAKGYLSDDGTFFENKPEADRHDAEEAIRAWCESHKKNADALLDILHGIAYLTRNYLDADQKCQEPRCTSHQRIAVPQAHPTDQS